MAPDAINGVGKVSIPVPPGAKPATEAAPTEAAAKPEGDKSWYSRVGDMFGNAVDAVTGPSMSAIAAAASPFTFGLSSLYDYASRVWTKSSQVKTQAFLDANLAKFTPAGQAALKKLQAEGKLDMVDPGWNNLRDNLDAYLKGGGDIAAAEAALAQIANPVGTIEQATEHACVAATIQLAIARDNPAQYFQMATALAATGAAKLPNGDTIQVSEKNLAWIDAQGLTGDARTNALFQAALMDYASDGGYDMAEDLVTTKEEHMTTVMHGLRPAQARKLNEALLQTPVLDATDMLKRLAAAVLEGGSREGATVDALLAAVEEAKKGGHGGVLVVVSAGNEIIELPPGVRNMLPPEDRTVPRYHMVLVKDVKDGQVTFVDPTGQTRTESLEDFARRICTDESVYVGAGGSYGTGASTSGGRGGR
jgi:hypothetical protein